MRSAPTTSTSRKKISRTRRARRMRKGAGPSLPRPSSPSLTPTPPGEEGDCNSRILLAFSVSPLSRREGVRLGERGRGSEGQRRRRDRRRRRVRSAAWASDRGLPRRRFGVAAALVDDGHADQADDEEEGRRKHGRALGAGHRGDGAEDGGAQHVGPLAGQAPETEKLAALLLRREQPHQAARDRLQRADPQAGGHGNGPELSLAGAEVGRGADQDPEHQGDLDRPLGTEAVLKRAEKEGSSRRGELQGDEKHDDL